MTEAPAALDFGLINRLLVEATAVGFAVVDPEADRVVFANQRLLSWLPGAATLTPPSFEEMLPEIDENVVRERLNAGETFESELSFKVKRRPITVLVRVQNEQRDGRWLWVVEVQNISKLKELEQLIESYSKMIERQNRSLAREKERAEKLLLNIMPKAVYEELKSFGVTTPHRYEQASVLMLDFVGFAQRSMTIDAGELVGELNDLFTNFDRIAEQFDCERIKTLGDAYIAVSGVPDTAPDHASNVARVALLIRRYLMQRNKTQRIRWECRIGLGTGPVIGSVIGVQKYVYDVFGASVNLAARCEALSGPMEISLSDATADLISDEFLLRPVGDFDLKGLGVRPIYRLTGATDLSEPQFFP